MLTYGKRFSTGRINYIVNKTDFPPQISGFLNAERELALPFSLMLAGERYHCSKILRLLPARRMVLLAETDDGNKVVIKCFARTGKARRDFKREQQGYQWVREAGITTPLQITVTETAKLLVVIYQYQEHDAMTSKTAHTDAMFRLIAQMHQKGLYQDDIHLDNVLLSAGKASLIDLASVKQSKQMPLGQAPAFANLAKFIAQFTLAERDKVLGRITSYFTVRSLTYDHRMQTKLYKALERAWLRRKRIYLAKCLRSCTMTAYHQDNNWQYAANRLFWQASQLQSVVDVEALFQSATRLKAGNTATVIRTQIAGQDVVIKRYNIKNWRHALSRCWRASRARHSWRNANLLAFIGINTPKPLAFIEKRYGWFRATAYFICEYVEAEELLDCYQHRAPLPHEMQQISAIFQLLRKARISHGDMKAQNLLLTEDGKVLLIDLDAMKECSSEQQADKMHQRDVSRFIRNWTDTSIKDKFERLLK